MKPNELRTGQFVKLFIEKYKGTNKKTGEKEYDKYTVNGVVIPSTCGSNVVELITPKGENYRISFDNIVNVTSTRIDAKTKDIMREIAICYATIESTKKTMSELYTKQYKLNNDIKQHIEQLKMSDGTYTISTVKSLFESEGYRVSSEWREGKANCITLEKSDEGERYSKNDLPYSFIHMRYDGSVYADSDSPSAKAYAKRNAPAINEKLKSFSKKVSQEVSVGDKHIYAITQYDIVFKNGFKIEDVDAVVSAIK
jgi:hypothetical protein